MRGEGREGVGEGVEVGEERGREGIGGRGGGGEGEVEEMR